MNRLRRSLAAIAVATAAAVGMTAGAGSASAATVRPAAAQDSIQTFTQAVWGDCMDDSVPAGLRGYGCNYGPYQQWRVHVWNDGTRRLQNVATGRCISDAGNTLVPATCDASTRQSWFVERSGGSVKFVNQQYRNCITEYGAPLSATSCTSPFYSDSPWWY